MFLLCCMLAVMPFPIQFSIPESKVVPCVPDKEQAFATVNPYDRSTYIYDNEKDYYEDYQRSYYAITCKKAGWDCMRHYEILANGAIPYFVDLDKAPDDTMVFLPRELILEAMHLEGVDRETMTIDFERFDKARYFEIAEELLEHTRRYLTTRKMAEYVLERVNYTGNGKVLYISGCLWPDYMRCTLLIGLREVLGNRLIDYPQVPHLYTSYPQEAVKGLYGKGISYSRVLENLPINRDNIEERIRNKEFDLIVYGSVHRGLGYHDLVKELYHPDQIVYICGEDIHGCDFYHHHNLFLREFDWNREKSLGN